MLFIRILSSSVLCVNIWFSYTQAVYINNVRRKKNTQKSVRWEKESVCGSMFSFINSKCAFRSCRNLFFCSIFSFLYFLSLLISCCVFFLHFLYIRCNLFVSRVVSIFFSFGSIGYYINLFFLHFFRWQNFEWFEFVCGNCHFLANIISIICLSTRGFVFLLH